MIADGTRGGVCVRTPDMRWLRARGGPLWYRRYFQLALLALGCAGSAATAWTLSYRLFGASAQATVVAIVPRPNAKGSGPVYCPEFSFRNAMGKQVAWDSPECATPAAWKIGERAQVFYDPSDPSTGVARSFARQWSIPPLAGAFALTFLLAGAAPQVLRERRLKRRTWLVLHGRRIDTELLGVGRNALALWGAERPYRIFSQWRDPRTGLVYEFHSVDLWVEPSAWLPRRAIPVRIDPANPKRYDMDLGFVPAEIHEA